MYICPPHSSAGDNAAEQISISTEISDYAFSKTCTGHVNTTECWFASAIAEYPVRVVNGTVSLLEAPVNPKIVARANNTSLTREIQEQLSRGSGLNLSLRTTLSGILLAAIPKYSVRQGIGES